MSDTDTVIRFLMTPPEGDAQGKYIVHIAYTRGKITGLRYLKWMQYHTTMEFGNFVNFATMLQCTVFVQT